MATGYARAQYKGKQILAHRLAYCLANDLEPEQIKGVVIRHRCDNPSCVNPEHLEPGTQADNLHDMTKRGRRAIGEAVGGSKLTEEQIREICASYKPYSKDANQYVLAERYGVSQPEISMVINGHRWSHIKQE